MPGMIDTALALAARGLHVFPCLPRAKQPATPHGCLDASVEREIIRAWWKQEPAYNVAVATGTISKVFALDVDDSDDGGDGESALRRLEIDHGKLPPTVEVITARGRHLYFRMPDRPVRNSAGKIAAGIDVRGTGGYVLAPPSVHPSGRAYCWSVDCARTFAAAPAWLLDKVSERQAAKQPTPPSAWRALMTDGVDEGQRDNAATRLSGYLLRRHVDPIVVHEILQLWNAARCRPPLPEEDVARVVDSICGRELRRRQGNG